jgi:hypothetical protein
MRYTGQLNQRHNSRRNSGPAYLLSRELSPSQTAMVNQIREQEANVTRLQMMEQETTDPLAARLLQDIVSDMEAELQRRVDRLVAERH